MMRFFDAGSMFGLACGDIFLPQVQAGMVDIVYDFEHGKLEDTLTSCDLLILGGGEDISPKVYGQRNIASYAPDEPSARDRIELKMFEIATKHGIPILGVCRGAQMVCAASGGSLVQHVDNHAGGEHSIVFDEGVLLPEDRVVLPITSAHHQMMYPGKIKHHTLAWTLKRGRQYIHDIPEYEQKTIDPEIVYFYMSHALGIQGHPEWMDPMSETVVAVRRLVRDYLHVDLNEVQ